MPPPTNATPTWDDTQEAPSWEDTSPDLSSVGSDAYDKFKLQEATAASAGLPLDSYQASVPPSLNPDFDFTRATGGNPTLAIMGAAAKGLSHAVAEVAVPVITGLKRAMAPETALMNQGRADITPVEEGKPMLNLPRLTPAEMESATPGERTLAGVGEGLAGAYESFTTPESVALLPLAEAKPVQAMFATQMAAAIPESLKAVDAAKTPDEKSKAITSLGLNVALTSALTHSMMKEGVQNASQVTSPEGIPVPEVRQQVGQEAPLQQQGKTAAARAPVIDLQTTKSEVPLSYESARLLAPHFDNELHTMGTLGDNQIMMADHENGKIVVDPEEFSKWVANDLKGLKPKEKAAAVQAMFDEENIHLKTDPEDAETYEKTLSPIEKQIFTRNYMRGSTEALSPRNLGFEVIRKRVQQAAGMTPSEFIGLSIKERWTAKALDALAETVAKIRRLKDKELNANQKAILDKVMGNIAAAKNALASQTQASTQAESQYVEGPFSRRANEPDDLESPLPKLHPGERVVLVKRPDGSIYRAAYSGKQYDVSAGGRAMVEQYGGAKVDAIGTVNERGEWTHGLLPKGDKIIKGFSPYAAVERSGEPEGPAARRNSDYAEQEAQKLDEEASRLRASGNHKDADELAAMAKTLRQKTSEDSFPAARRRADKGNVHQENLFAAPITQKGIPGEEPTAEGHAAATAAGAHEFVPEQKIFPKEIAFDPKAYGAKSLPVRPITASEAKSERELGKILTADARKGGSDLPVSTSKRLTVLFDKTDGTVHMVSTYAVPRTKGYETLVGPRLTGKTEASHAAENPIAYVVDPEIAGRERNSRPIEEILHRYEPIASVLLRDAKQGFHQKFNSMADFQEMFGNEASQMAREHGTGTEGIPKGTVSAASIETEGHNLAHEPTEKFQIPREHEPNLPRPTTEELKAFHNFFGDVPPSDALMFSRRIEKQAATASRTMINGLRKLVRIERAQTRGLSEGEAIGRVIDRLYENYSNSETRSEFVARTTEQGNFGTAKEIPPGGAPRKTGARELSTLRDVAPTTVRGVHGPRPETPTAELPPPEEVEKLSPEEQQALDEEIRKHHPPQFEVSPRTTLGKQVLETTVPKQPYSVGKSRPISKVEYVDPDTGEIYEKPYQADSEINPEEEDAAAEAERKQKELFPTREVQSESPEKPAGESLAAMKKAVAKGEGNKPQLDFWKQQGPAARRRAAETVDKIKDYLERTGRNISTAGDLSDQLHRLKTGEKADYDLAVPVIKSAIKIIPEGDRASLLKYADETQVMGKSDIKLTDAQQMMYDTFIKPLLDDNQRMYSDLQKAGVPVGESTYLGRIVQDTHSLYSRLWRGTKQRITEGSILGQGASFFKRRVFKALEDSDGNRSLIALVGAGDRTKVIGYSKGKAELMGKMPPDSLKRQPLNEKQIRTQRVVEARRLQELDKLDKENFALLKEQDRLEKLPPSPDRDVRLQGINDRLSSTNGDYLDVENKYPTPQFETPKMWVDKKGKLWKVTDATVGEIESNTNTRYYKEPVSGIITQNLKLKQIYRANEFLENLKNSDDFKRVSRGVNERNVPEDWLTVDLPQLRGLRIEPRTADVLDLFAQEQKGPSLPFKFVNGLTQFLRNSLFIWNPFVHEPNLLTHWFTARGTEWAKPVGYDRMFKSGAAALNDVLTRSRFRDEALRAGAPLMRGMGKMNQQIMTLLRKELDPNPSLGTKVARVLGYINVPRMIRAFGDSLTWGTNEVLTLQLIRETMNRTGLSMEDAISEVGKHMPNYRVPPRVLNSRLISQVMRNPMLTLWGHYHYGALRSYGEMGKEIFSPSSTMGQRVEGLGRVATIGFLMALAYPTLDELINKVIKTKGLKMRRAGSTTVPSNIIDLLQGNKTPEAVAQSIVTPSPVPVGAIELAFNRNLRSGMPIYERHLGVDMVKDLASFGASKISPVEEAGKVFGGKKSSQEFGLGLAGITRTRADSAMSQFGRMADNWMRHSPDESIRDQYKRRTQDVFPESDYQLLRSAVIREDYRAGQMAMEKLLKNRKPAEVMQRIKQWQDSPFTGTRKTDKALMAQMTPEDWDLWYQAAQERLDIADGMVNHLVDAVTKPKE